MKILKIINIPNYNRVEKANFKRNNNFGISFKQEIPNDEFVSTNRGIDIARIKDLGIKHFRLIDSNSIRGVTLANQDENILEELKECGINTIVDLRTEGSKKSKYSQKCKNHGLEYLNFKLKNNMPIFNILANCNLPTDERNQKIDTFVSKLPAFFKIMDEGHFYMSCLLGLHRTDLAVTLNYLINPKEPESPPILSHMYYKDETNFTNKYIGAMKNLLRNITPEHKKLLKLPENYQEIFNERIMKLRIMNAL